ncbi:hypothetical protein PCANB_001473 [Pneumocystis canis]|nr:hypothetical protein PCANB_001473 [Pneumocystis canis]
MGNRISSLNKNENVKSEKDVFDLKKETCQETDSELWKSFSPISSPKNNQRPIRERYIDRSSIQTIIHYLYNNNDEFNYDFHTSTNIDEELLELSILITDKAHDFSNLQPHPLFQHVLKDLSMYISSKKNLLTPPIVSKISPGIFKFESKIKPNISIDPLSDNLFHLNHKRFDRQEKHIRNIEHERFAHDRFYLEQKIDQLYGSDWKKVVMAVSKITGSKDPLETQRQYIIQKLEQVLKKFNSWKESQLRSKRKSKKVIDLDKNYISKTTKVNSSKKQKLNTGIPETLTITGIIETNKSNTNKSIQKKQKKSTNLGDSLNNDIITPLFYLLPKNKFTKDQDVLIGNDDKSIENENTSKKDKNKSSKNENITNKNERVFIQNERVYTGGEKKLSKIIHSSTENQKKSTFIKSPHIKQAITNNWRRSSRIILAFGQPLPRITTKVQEFSLPFEILENAQR